MTVFWVGLIATVVIGIGSYLMRSSFILALADRDFHPVVREGLGYVAPSVMAALVVSLALDGSSPAGWIDMVALVVGGVVGWRTRSLPWVLVAGMSTLWVLRALF